MDVSFGDQEVMLGELTSCNDKGLLGPNVTPPPRLSRNDPKLPPCSDTVLLIQSRVLWIGSCRVGWSLSTSQQQVPAYGPTRVLFILKSG